MSVAVMAWAFQQKLPSTEKFVLVALADRANDDGHCWPGQRSLADKCSLSRQTVNRCVKTLETKGLLKIEARVDDVGRPLSNRYFLNWGGTVSKSDRGMSPTTTGTVSQSDTDPSEDPSKEDPSVQTGESDALKPEDVIEGWNEQIAPLGLPKVCELTPKRKQMLTARIREHPDIGFWEQVLGNIVGSRFLRGLANGNGHSNWRANFDWVMEKPERLLRIYEGTYV